jgi:hypothetical protein
MQATPVTYYIPRQTVVLYDGTSSRRYQTVYAKNLKIHKGIDNRLQFQFVNQDQRAVDITGKTLTCRLISYDGSKVLLQKALTPVFPLTGICQLDVTMNETLEMEAAMCYYSITIPNGAFEFPVFVDDNSGGRGVVDVVNSVMPKYTKSTQLDILPHADPSDIQPVTYYTGQYVTQDSDFLTFQTVLNNYVGTIKVQGSATGHNTEWYDLTDPQTYDGYTSTDYFNVNGYHPYMQVVFTSTQGTVDKVLVR